jgi:hypothetical protein
MRINLAEWPLQLNIRDDVSVAMASRCDTVSGVPSGPGMGVAHSAAATCAAMARPVQTSSAGCKRSDTPTMPIDIMA